jgi:uncharacterized membrane protein
MILTPLQLRMAQLSAVFMLILLLSFYQLSLPDGPVYKIWLLQLVPLVIFLPGLYQLKRRSYQWLAFVILLYFIRAVTGVMSPAASFFDVLLLALSVLIFCLSLLASRVLVGSSAAQ